MIIIIDFGSQYNQLIARRVRECQVFCRIEAPDIDLETIRKLKPAGIILSGGPSSIYTEQAPVIDQGIFELGIPVLGICYGMHFMIQALGGVVACADKHEYGSVNFKISNSGDFFKGIVSPTQCWMSHGDSIQKLPQGFTIAGSTANTAMAAVCHARKKLYGVQFHPEVEHTPKGRVMLKNFLFTICQSQPAWSMKTFAEDAIQQIRKKVSQRKIILGLSGGVDSSVTALLINRAVGSNLTCIFVDNGLMRMNETEQLKKIFKQNLELNTLFVEAGSRFIKALTGISDPEKKRKIIGHLFIQIFEEQANKIKDVEFLAQGTLYPDVIESVSAFGGPSAVIKSHHNVGGLPQKMKLKLVEPLKYLFKDEVRQLGLELGLAPDMVWRQPFPGPGLAIRIIGEITPERLQILRELDFVLLEEIRKSGYYKKLWQSFAVLLPLKSVGIMGDQRTYENIAAIRAVTSKDAMTADWARLPHELLAVISNRIINEVRGVNRVVYDISSKPPSTIEWE